MNTVNLGFTGVYIFLIFALLRAIGYLLERINKAVMQCKQNLCFEQRKIFLFSSENCHFVLLKPVLGGVSSIAIFSTGHK